MRLMSIWLLALGFTTLVACGGSVEVTTGDETEEEAGGDEGEADEGEADEEEGEADEGEEAGDDGEATAQVCCELNKGGKKMRRRMTSEVCSERKGNEMELDKCPDKSGGR